MVSLKIAPEEIAGGVMKAENLDAAVQAVLADGFVVLENVVDRSHLDALRERMLEDLEALLAREDAPFNWNVGNAQQDPPPFPPYLFQDVLLNDMVIAVTHAVLGPGVKNSMYGGNTAMPSEHRQPVHGDATHLWPRLEVAHPPAMLVVNVPVVDMHPENGGTEIWPGTHRIVAAVAGQDIKISPDMLEARRAVSPPLQPVVPLGSVLIRDMRLWHAGMPNRTDRPRPMIAMIHNAGWLETGDPLRFPAGTEEFFDHPILQTCARFVDEPIDHIRAPHGYEYEK